MATRRSDSVDGIQLGINIARLREEREWSRADLEKASGLSAGYIYRIEKGQHENASKKTANKLARAFGLPVEALLNEVETTPLTPDALQGLEAELWEIAHKKATGKTAQLLFEALRNTLSADAEGQARIHDYTGLILDKYAPHLQTGDQKQVNEEREEYTTGSGG